MPSSSRTPKGSSAYPDAACFSPNAGLGCSAARRLVDRRRAAAPSGSDKALTVGALLGEFATVDRARETLWRAHSWAIEDLGVGHTACGNGGAGGWPRVESRSVPGQDGPAGSACECRLSQPSHLRPRRSSRSAVEPHRARTNRHRQRRIRDAEAHRRPDLLDPQALAGFYSELLGMILVQDESDWVAIGDAPDRPGVAFQRVPQLAPATWPSGERPQYRHFDVAVADLHEADEQVLALGARRLAGGGAEFRVYADPAGHPFSWSPSDLARTVSTAADRPGADDA